MSSESSLALGQLVAFIDNATRVGEREPTQPFVDACIDYGAEGDVGKRVDDDEEVEDEA